MGGRLSHDELERFDCLGSPPIDATRSRILSLMSKTMDDLIVDLLRKYPEGVTSAFIHETVANSITTLARTEDRLDDLIKDGVVVLVFIDGQAIYAIA